MGDEHIKEASWVAQSAVGSSAYMYGIDYSSDQFKQELASIVEHIEQAAQNE